MSTYSFTEIEKKWQGIWEKNQIYKTTEAIDKPKYYVLDMFPYPSGSGLHVGHPLGYIASDVVSRFKRLQGYNVLHPMGFDAFGLPAEQYAIETGQHPSDTTDKNIQRYKEQLKNIGFCYDWDREIKTSDPNYYKWTQWIFLQLFESWYNPESNKAEPIDQLIQQYRDGHRDNSYSKPWDELTEVEQQNELTQHRLAYKDESFINWCEALGTVLANDEVVNGVSERGGHPVERKRMSQWFLRITKYADRLLDGLEQVDFPESLKEMQRNWIGKSEGAEIVFELMEKDRYGNSNAKNQDISQDLTMDFYKDLTPGPSPKEERGEPSDNKPSDNNSSANNSSDKKPSDDEPMDDKSARIMDFTRYTISQRVILENARTNRKNSTEAEKLLWLRLRSNALGIKFRRQYPIEDFIADFASVHSKIIIETDGGYHKNIEQIEYDEARDHRLKQLGFDVIRFTNEEVLNNIDTVLLKIKVKIKEAEDHWNHRSSKVEFEAISISTTEKTESAGSPLSSLGEGTGVRSFKKPNNENSSTPIKVFTTRPDTIFGVSFLVIAPEHPLVDSITTTGQKEEVSTYVDYCKSRTELERKSETKEITGVRTGAYVLHPFTQNLIPVFIAEYVLMGYGTGAIMAVPCGDSRDYAFAKKFDLPIPNIFDGVDISAKAYEEKAGKIANSSCDWFSIDGLSIADARLKVLEKLEEESLGTLQINYRMRDAGFSRQRYWGEPFPISYNDKIAFTDSMDELPIVLPEVSSYKPSGDGKSPLANIDAWVNLPNGNTRETDTMPGYAGSSWYYLRYMDPHNATTFCDKSKSEYWQQVDLYIGGAEHAVGHLLYSRMWCKALCDLGYINFDEPYKKLLNQGMIGGVVYYCYYDQNSKKIVSHSLTANQTHLLRFQVPNEYVNDDETFDQDGITRFCDEFTQFKDYEFVMDNGLFTFEKAITKMSKRLRNVVNPDEVIAKYGADTFRMYEMFLGPIDQDKPWNTKGIDGVSRFIKRFWAYCTNDNGNLLLNEQPADESSLKIINRTLKKVAEDIEKYAFNTCVSSFMICFNELQANSCRNKEIFEKFLIMLSPFAPHITEELWRILGNETSIITAVYPVIDEKYLKDDDFNYPISINGKTRTLISFPLDASEEDIQKTVLNDPTVMKWIEGKPIKKFILVKGRIVNVVV